MVIEPVAVVHAVAHADVAGEVVDYNLGLETSAPGVFAAGDVRERAMNRRLEP